MLSGFLNYGKKNLLGIQNELNPLDEDKKGSSQYYQSTVSFNQISAGNKINVIPDTCNLDIDMRILPGITIQDALDAFTKYATKLNYRIEVPKPYSNTQKSISRIQNRPVDIELIIKSQGVGRMESKESELCTILASQFEKVYRKSHFLFYTCGLTDASHLGAEGGQNIIVFGPSGENPHSANEFVYIDDLVKCTKVYLLTAFRYLNASSN